MMMMEEGNSVADIHSCVWEGGYEPRAVYQKKKNDRFQGLLGCQESL